MSRNLDNYLRTYRKKAGLSQDEVAFLLGSQSGAKVSRYERHTREPNLRTLFALEVIFRAPSRKLFAGIYERVERITVKRASALVERFAAIESPDRMLAHKLAALKAIVEEAAHLTHRRP